jgi:hypothetical protein
LCDRGAIEADCFDCHRDVFDLTRDYNTILEVWGEPRTYGVTLSLNW